jgi:hypothetical protein
MDLANLLKQPPPRATRERFAKAVMLGIVLPAGIILALQYTRYSIFPGKTGVVWNVLDVAVFGFLLLYSLWEWMERRRGKA